jgi:prevent-host-death family protein
MSSVGIKELKNRLTYYIRLAKKGEELVVTERGKPVALIQALRSATDVTTLEAKLARLAAQGAATLPDRQPSRSLKAARVRGTPVSRIILEERR